MTKLKLHVDIFTSKYYDRLKLGKKRYMEEKFVNSI